MTKKPKIKARNAWMAFRENGEYIAIGKTKTALIAQLTKAIADEYLSRGCIKYDVVVTRTDIVGRAVLRSFGLLGRGK